MVYALNNYSRAPPALSRAHFKPVYFLFVFRGRGAIRLPGIMVRPMTLRALVVHTIRANYSLHYRIHACTWRVILTLCGLCGSRVRPLHITSQSYSVCACCTNFPANCQLHTAATLFNYSHTIRTRFIHMAHIILRLFFIHANYCVCAFQRIIPFAAVFFRYSTLQGSLLTRMTNGYDRCHASTRAHTILKIFSHNAHLHIFLRSSVCGYQ